MRSGRLICSSVALVFVCAGLAPAQVVQWVDGGASPLWGVPENWDTGVVPTASDTVNIHLADANCVIDSTVTADCSTLSVGGAVDGNCYLDMTGGTLTVTTADPAAYGLHIGQSGQGAGTFIMSGGVATLPSRLAVGTNGTGTFILRGGTMDIGGDAIEVGRNATGVGTIRVEGGVLNLTGPSADLAIGTYGTGTFRMTGGLVTVQDSLKLSQGSAAQTTGVSYLNLDGGVLEAEGLRNPAEGIFGRPRIDITQGTLILRDDDRAIVRQYVSRGWLVAYHGGQGLVRAVWSADPNQTTVTGVQLAPEQASYPAPSDQAVVSKPVTLSWRPGSTAVRHDVYFGTDANDVSTASRTSDPNGVLVSQGQDPNTYAPAVVLGKTYYWRVDEVDHASPPQIWKGALFEFTVAPYVLVEDFESYDDQCNRIFFTWLGGAPDSGSQDPACPRPPYVGNGTGSEVGNYGVPFAERTILHSGQQSMPVAYNNSIASYSEISVKTADLHVGMDWSDPNLASLSLWFYGAATNSAETMYVKLNDTKVDYRGAATDLQQAFWQEWLIDLGSFGTDLKKVTDLTIGFSRGAGGSGRILFDDIRLTTVVPDASLVQLARWPLNGSTTTSSAASDKVTASAQTATSLYVIRDYGGIDGSQRVYGAVGTLGNWPDETAQNPDRYAQFAFTPNPGVSVKVTALSLSVGNSGGSTDVKVSLYYSTDDFVTSQVLEEAIALPSSALLPKTYTLNVQVPSGRTFSLRACPWLQGGRASGKYFNIKDVMMSGTTTP